jgi:uncharacterized protein YjbI with pentapeptide repeats
MQAYLSEFWTMRHGCAKAFVPALALAIVLAGCSDGDHNGSSTSDQSPQVNYNEHDFALDPDLRANPDDILTLQLEDPSADEDDEVDTGEAAGTDVVPYVYVDTAERTFCWKVSDSELASGAPSQMRLINDANGDEVLRVEEGGDCVTQTVAAGNYHAVFDRTRASGDRDLVFIVPQAEAVQTGARALDASDQAAHDADAPATVDQAPAPPCDFYYKDAPSSFVPSALILRVITPRLGDRCNAATQFPFEAFLVGERGCADLSLIRGECTPNGMVYLAATVFGHQMRVYDDVFFRGPRKTVITEPFPDGNIDQISAALLKTFVIGNAMYGIHGPGSVVMLGGTPPALNNVVLILTGGCDHCDLSGLNLDGVDLHGASLRQADLSHASLQGANLSGIVASGAIFKSAYLAGADLRQADLETATFDSAGVVEGMSGQVYPAADLSDAKLDGAVLTTASLHGATLTNATFSHATLDFADLGGASAKGAVFENASLMSARLTDAFLENAAFDAARLDDANLQGATLIDARLPGAHLERASLHKDRDHLAAALNGAYMANATLDDADLTGVSMQDARFYGGTARAVGAILDEAHLDGAVLSGANFTGASFRSATLSNAACVNCQFNTAKLGRTASQLTDAATFVGTDLRGADFSQATVDGCNFTGATVSFADTTGSYRYGTSPDVVYVAQYPASKMDKVMTETTVRCPNGAPGPCNTREKLSAPQPTPTATARPSTPTRTPGAGCTPDPLHHVFCSTATPTPAS